MQPRAVLLVNDDPDFVAALSGLLEGEGYPVVTASGTAEALERLQYVQPVMILADFRALPGQRPTLLTVLRERGLYEDVPKLVLSAESPDVIEARMRAAAVDAPYLHQLTDLPVLLRAVHDAFDVSDVDTRPVLGRADA